MDELFDDMFSGDEPEDDDDYPYCLCQTEFDEEEQASNRCKSCGKPALF